MGGLGERVFEAQSAKRKTWRAVASNVSPGSPHPLAPRPTEGRRGTGQVFLLALG
jgi:hypothetical protein